MKGRGVVYRVFLMVALAVVAAVYLAPSLVTELPEWWRKFLPDQRIHLGLDLRGGTHLLLTVDVQKALANAVERTSEELKQELRDAGIHASLEQDGHRILLRLTNREKRRNLEQLVADRFPNLTSEPSSNGDQIRVTLTLTRREVQHIQEFALDQSLETIRNRIDQFGVSEPTIQRQGSQDILIQLPGIEDPQRAKELIGRTAMLEFKLVAESPAPQEVPEERLPPGTERLSGPEVDSLTGQVRRVSYLVEKRTLMTGDAVADARVRPGIQLEGPYVELVLDSRGAKVFDKVTGENVGRRLAIVLDNTVYSAPVIRERIGGGRASITGNFDIKEARDLAIVLRAGALPAPVEIVEERTVGPSLGKDSIRQGIISFITGGTLVVVFMGLYYRWGGILADLALILNILFLLAALAAFAATLTLPGIGGIVLTMGMAVDANVLINERIREELRLGKTARAAIEAGYERALPAILDSNITTFLSGLILFQFGSGPVKGFAVTLCLGILTSVFTAVVGTRTVYDYLMATRRLTRVSV